jgi:hypothetical protein
MARATNAHVPALLRDDKDIPVFYPGMTRTSAKFQEFATAEAYQDPYRCGYPWSDWNMKWDQDRYRAPANRFGVKTAEDVSKTQTFAPGGMFAQLHAGKARGTEMTTKIFERFSNPCL